MDHLEDWGIFGFGVQGLAFRVQGYWGLGLLRASDYCAVGAKGLHFGSFVV